jgi:hypothetical protein
MSPAMVTTHGDIRVVLGVQTSFPMSKPTTAKVAISVIPWLSSMLSCWPLLPSKASGWQLVAGF